MGENAETGLAADGHTGQRPRSEDLEIALSVHLEVEREHAPWWNPGLKSDNDPRQSPAVGCVDGGVSVWVANECNCFRGRELSSEVE